VVRIKFKYLPKEQDEDEERKKIKAEKKFTLKVW